MKRKSSSTFDVDVDADAAAALLPALVWWKDMAGT